MFPLFGKVVQLLGKVAPCFGKVKPFSGKVASCLGRVEPFFEKVERFLIFHFRHPLPWGWAQKKSREKLGVPNFLIKEQMPEL